MHDVPTLQELKRRGEYIRQRVQDNIDELRLLVVSLDTYRKLAAIARKNWRPPWVPSLNISGR